MREISADAWEVDCDVLCITTNCTIRNDQNVMGGGIAREVAVRDPDIPGEYADLIKAFGHHVYLMKMVYEQEWEDPFAEKFILMFPTKNEVSENSSLARVFLSVIETKALADIYGWKTIALPRPGCGLGGLDWHGKVRPFFERLAPDNAGYLDNRFLIVSYPGEK